MSTNANTNTSNKKVKFDLEHHDFNSYSGYNNDREIVKLPKDIVELRDKVVHIVKTIRENTKDTGWKRGIKSTDYRYETEQLTVFSWYADCEGMTTLLAHGVPIARCYDCYGSGFFEFINRKTIEKIYNEIIKIQEPKND